MSFEKWWKEVRCKHVYKESDEEFLRKSRESTGEINGIPHYSNYEYYAIKSTCIKCGKEKIEQKRYLII